MVVSSTEKKEKLTVSLPGIQMWNKASSVEVFGYFPPHSAAKCPFNPCAYLPSLIRVLFV